MNFLAIHKFSRGAGSTPPIPKMMMSAREKRPFSASNGHDNGNISGNEMAVGAITTTTTAITTTKTTTTNTTIKSARRKLDHATDFVSSMTFASVASSNNNAVNNAVNNILNMDGKEQSGSSLGLSSCECCDSEECEQIPLPIRRAIAKHKRSVVRNQQRTLLHRIPEHGVSVVRLTMPQHAKPLIEYGSAHRIIYIDNHHHQYPHKDANDDNHGNETDNQTDQAGSSPVSLPVWAIGRNSIVGSAAEASKRCLTGWEPGKAYLVPSNGGRALGWVHGNEIDKMSESHQTDKGTAAGDNTPTSSSTTPSLPPLASPIVLYTIKIPVALMIKNDGEKDDCKAWMYEMARLTKKYLEERKARMASTTNSKRDADSISYPLSVEDSKAVKTVVDTFL